MNLHCRLNNTHVVAKCRYQGRLIILCTAIHVLNLQDHPDQYCSASQTQAHVGERESSPVLLLQDRCDVDILHNYVEKYTVKILQTRSRVNQAHDMITYLL